ncbi:MAG: ABC transporter substrate-binding protein [Lachnospiraceae bacterium]|nr:ABC transporter substrate-binding protein [Lachnospiraceae bacterium]
MKKSLAVLLSAAMVLGLAACGGGSTSTTTAAPAETQAAAAAETQAAAPAAEAPAATESDGVLRVIQNFDPGTFEPGNNDEQGYNRITAQIYETLFRFDENGELQPWLAESYEWDDDTHLRIKLREGIKFSTGDEMTADDVVWTVTRAIETNLPNAKYNIVDHVEKVDDYTVIYALKYPSGTMPNHLAYPQCCIASKKAFEENNGDYLGGAVVGTGPYKVDEYVQGDIIRMSANENYWVEGLPKCKNLELRIVSSAESRATEAKTKQYDVVLNPNSREYDQIDAIDGVHVEYGQTAKTTYMLLNTKKAPMDNVKVREAFARAIDVTATVKLAYGSFGNPAQAFIVPGIAGFNEETYRKYYGQGHDVEAAKALLAEAGYANGVDVEITVESNNSQRGDMAEAIQAQVAEAGINVTINKMEDAPMREYIGAGNHQMCLYGFTANTMEADGFLNQIQPGSGALARIGYDRQEFFDKYQEGAATADPEARKAVWEECLEMLMEDYCMIPLNHERLGAVVLDGVEGFWWARDYEEVYYAYISK